MHLSYTVLARKYRPSCFAEVLGQDVAVQTISNAITLNRLPHAILLTGIRGTGKTTIARLIAKSLNCTTDSIPVVTSCGVCEQCITIANSYNPDVLEMDAASHTSVNDIREIIENSKYNPVVGRYRIYIIDEVHMLSTNAFNALLKTLEEPAQHIKFIFATTEIQKIPLTIVSRCQRFHLKRVLPEVLVAHYNQILTTEGYTADIAAINMIVAAASGSVRDGLSILDQVISACGQNKFITTKLVSDTLGIFGVESILSLFTALINGQVYHALSMAKKMYKDGQDPVMIVEELLFLVHQLSKFISFQTLHQHSSDSFFEMRNYTEKQLHHISGLLNNNITFLLISWHICIEALNEMKTIEHPFVCLEMTLIKLCYANIADDIRDAKEDDNAINQSTSLNIPMPDTVSLNALMRTISTDNGEFDNTHNKKNSANAKDIKTLLELIEQHNELMLYHCLTHDVGILEVDLHLPMLKIQAHKNTPNNIEHVMTVKLNNITSQNWKVEVSHNASQEYVPSLSEIEMQKKKNDIDTVLKNKVVQDILSTFDGVEVDKVTIK